MLAGPAPPGLRGGWGVRDVHVAMPIEGLHSCKQLVVVAHVNEHLRVVLDALLQHRQRTGLELVLVVLLLLRAGHLAVRLVIGRRSDRFCGKQLACFLIRLNQI